MSLKNKITTKKCSINTFIISNHIIQWKKKIITKNDQIKNKSTHQQATRLEQYAGNFLMQTSWTHWSNWLRKDQNRHTHYCAPHTVSDSIMQPSNGKTERTPYKRWASVCASVSVSVLLKKSGCCWKPLMYLFRRGGNDRFVVWVLTAEVSQWGPKQRMMESAGR